MHYLFSLFLSLITLITASCGFRLQDITQIPDELKTLKLSSTDPYGPLAHVIKQQLRLNSINLIDENFQNVPVLKIINSSENIKTISIYQDGKSAEKQLNFLISAQLILQNGVIYPIKTRVERVLIENPSETLSKDAENEYIKQEMREQALRQLISKLLIARSAFQNKPKELTANEKVLSVNLK